MNSTISNPSSFSGWMTVDSGVYLAAPCFLNMAERCTHHVSEYNGCTLSALGSRRDGENQSSGT